MVVHFPMADRHTFRWPRLVTFPLLKERYTVFVVLLTRTLSGSAAPGNIVMWRGLTRLTDIQLGYEMAQTCG